MMILQMRSPIWRVATLVVGLSIVARRWLRLGEMARLQIKATIVIYALLYSQMMILQMRSPHMASSNVGLL